MHTALFDLDGTLVDSVPDLASALNRLMAARGLAPFTEPEVSAMVGDGAGVLVARALAARGQPASDAATTEYVADYTRHAVERTRPYPGIVEALGVLRDAGWRLAVCTNKPERAARTVLDGLRLSQFFVAVGGGDSFSVRKPEAGHVLGTILRAGGVPGESVMIGDHHNDIASANAAGVKSVFAAWGYGARDMGGPASAIAESANDLPAILARLFDRDLAG